MQVFIRGLNKVGKTYVSQCIQNMANIECVHSKLYSNVRTLMKLTLSFIQQIYKAVKNHH